MRMTDLAELRQPRPYPAVSLLAPLQRHRPGNLEDPILLRDLVDRARRHLQDELGARDSTEVLTRLDDAIATLDLHHPSDGIAVFVAPGETHVLPLAFTVPERVQIDDTFATRDLVRGVTRTPRYRVLALGEKPTRLLTGTTTTLTETHSGGFPLFVEGALGEPLASGGFPVHSSRSEEQHHAFFREVDQALGVVMAEDPLSVVVAGTERDLAYFDQITKHRQWIVGALRGNYEDSAPDELAALTAPLLDAALATQRASVLAELVEAVGVDRGIVGVKAVWDSARAGRARVLLVEDDFVYPARLVDEHLEPAGDEDASGVIDDAVDELIEMVLDAGGEVTVFGSGELAEHGPVAALLRY